MARKITLDNLGDEIKKIMNDYVDDINGNLDVITKRIGQKGAQALKNESKAKFNGDKYAGGWTYQVEKQRLYTTVVIYNKKQAGLAHLLENGHVKANGTGRYGFYPGVQHIYPVEKELVASYESEVVNALK